MTSANNLANLVQEFGHLRLPGEQQGLMKAICKSVVLAIVVGHLVVEGQTGKPCDESLFKYPDLESQAIKKVTAAYPTEPGLRVHGKVAVRIVVDKKGNVSSAKFICGPPLLSASSVAAAIQWKFRPKRANGRAVKNLGIIMFDFPPLE